MNSAFASLTSRGRALAGVGLVLLAIGFSLADRDIARLALLLLIAPGFSAVAVARSQSRVRTQRWLTSPRAAVGDTVEVRIRIDNVSRIPTGVLLAEDVLPLAFGGRPRFVVDRLGGAAGVDVHYPMRCELRGRYRVGPVTLRLRDPFGLAEVTRSFDQVDELVVTPIVHPLPTVRLTGEWAGLGESTRRSVASSGEDDAATREYRLGDDLRRIHWRSTARRGELMVRREEQPWQSRAALLLDTRQMAHAGEGAGSSLEWAISAAASIAAHLDHIGFEFRLIYDTGADVSGARATGRALDVTLESLATCQPSRGTSLTPGLTSLRRGGGEGLVIAVVAGLDDADIEGMLRARGAGVTSVAVVLDPSTWSRRRSGGPDNRAKLLAAAGWRIETAERGSDIAAVWRHIGSDLSSGLTATAGLTDAALTEPAATR